MKFEPSFLGGLFLIQPEARPDARGHFVKTFHAGEFLDHGIEFSVAESFFSVSHRNVLRGMHFQNPPAAHAKLVYCPVGAILDVVIDLRRTSPTYGRHHAFELSAKNNAIIYVPKGFAHGFLSLHDGSVTVYGTTEVYSAKNDSGIRWDSIGFNWPDRDPVVSVRDLALPGLAGFDSPFV